jgi:hypothetical protein
MEKMWQFGWLMHDSREVIRLIEERPALRRKIKPSDSLFIDRETTNVPLLLSIGGKVDIKPLLAIFRKIS